MKTGWLAVISALLLAACANSDMSNNQSNRSLTGSWRLTEVAAQSIAMNNAGPKVLKFESNPNKVSGNVGCNRVFGVYEQQGASLQFNGVAATRMACDPLSMQIEQKVIDSLEKVQTWQINGQELQFKDANQQVILKFQRL